MKAGTESITSCSSIRQTCVFNRVWTTLLSVAIFLSPGRLNHPQVSWAQEAAECGISIISTSFTVQNATGVSILRAAANCSNVGPLEVGWAGAITLDAPISIASGTYLSITGDNDVSLAEVRGGSQTRMFEISQGGGLALTHVKLSGGAAGSGGAIYSDTASLTLNNCSFHGNVATEGDGGALWARGGNVTVLGGEFAGNNATSGFGGAVAVTGANLVVQEGSRFEGNNALVGGALYCNGEGSLLNIEEYGFSASSATTTPSECTLSETEFRSNSATGNTLEDAAAYFRGTSEGFDGGGAAAFLFASVSVTNSVFSGNFAEHSGGAVVAGNGTDIKISGGVFENNAAEDFGGAIAASFLTLGGGTQLIDNVGTLSGGAVFGWDASGVTVFDDVVCRGNTADRNGGCFRASGTATVNNATSMHDNTAVDGGCIYAHEGSNVHVTGGDFGCQSSRRGGFFFAGDSTNVTITAGLISGNSAGTRGGGVFCSGYGDSTLTVEGGIFTNNSALEYGGAISATGEDNTVLVTGGIFSNNSASFYGGFLYISEGVSFACEGATASYNYAGDQGGGIYAREASWVNSSCDLIGNESPQGAALYLTGVESATLENHVVTNNVALSGSVFYMTESLVVADRVSFVSGVGLQEDSYNRAIQSDGDSALTAKECVFSGWLGDTIIYHRNADAGSLSLDRCDFSGSSAIMAVFSLNSDAHIRNAVFDDAMLENVARLDNSLMLVNQALTCSDGGLCGPGECVDSELGVLCQCIDATICLDDGGAVSLNVKTPPAAAVYSPDGVSFELGVSAALSGTTHVIWELVFESDDLELDVAPSSGVLPAGGSLTISVIGVANGQDLAGTLTSRFNLTSVGGNASSNTTAGATLEVDSTFFLCHAYEYARPVSAADGGGGVVCEQCISIEGGEGVNCDSPGATLASLPIREGYWRSGRDSLVVHKCTQWQGCAGATEVSSANDYCEDGYQGPYCSVCSGGYGRCVSNICLSCDSFKAQLLLAAGILASLVMVLLCVFLGVVFLAGGLDPVDAANASALQTFSLVRKVSRVWPAPETDLDELRGPVTELHGLHRSVTVSQDRKDPVARVPKLHTLMKSCKTLYDSVRGGGLRELPIPVRGTGLHAPHHPVRGTGKRLPNSVVTLEHDRAWERHGWHGGRKIDSGDFKTEARTVFPSSEDAESTNASFADGGIGAGKRLPNGIVNRERDLAWGRRGWRGRNTSDIGEHKTESQPGRPSSVDAESAKVAYVKAGIGAGGGRRPPHLSERQGSAEKIRVSSPQRYNSTVPDARKAETLANSRGSLTERSEGETRRGGVYEALKRWGSRRRVDRLKILVVVWQILSSFPSITGVEFPSSYSAFLSWINFVNLDIGLAFSGSCVLPPVNFYVRLLIMTLTPLVLAGVLVLTYWAAVRRAGIASAGLTASRAACSRHAAAGFLLTFMVYTSASTLAFKTFACDDAVGDGSSYLRADYSISCGSTVHTLFKVYAAVMILVYPIGIPALYATILWRKRELLMPVEPTTDMSGADETTAGTDTTPDSAEGDRISFIESSSLKSLSTHEVSPQSLREYTERVRARERHPELTPSLLLWIDFVPDLFYYEVIECGRRLLLTAGLLFIAPDSSTQVATACMFAFASIGGFELLRPHRERANLWLYRVGCLVIFLSCFLALLVRMDVAGDTCLSALGAMLVAFNVVLVLMVVFASRSTVR